MGTLLPTFLKILIVPWTNIKLTSMREYTRFDDNSYRPTDIYEIKALLRLLVLSCTCKLAGESLSSLFCTEPTGRPIFSAAMSEKRCNILIRALRFDDSLTRLVEEKEDPAAAISDVFNRFIKNCQ